MGRKIVFMYAGQGSGYYYMGESLYNNSKVFKYWMDLSSEVIQDYGFPSLITELYKNNKKNDSFDKIEVSHPATVVFQYALTMMLKDAGIFPDTVWGNSVGELAASAAADIISFESMIKATIDQVKTLKEKCENGNMLAIMGDRSKFENIDEFKACDIAGVNFDNHFVLSGSEKVISNAYNFAKKNRIISQIILTNFGFHSYAIDDAKIDIIHSNSSIEYTSSSCKYISTTQQNYVKEGEGCCFWDAIRKPLEFKKTFLNVYNNNHFYVDLSPSGTLATFLKYNINDNQVRNFSRTLQRGDDNLGWIEELKDKIKSDL